MEESAPLSSLLYPVINFAILVAGMFYYLSKPTKAFVQERHTVLKDELDRVQLKLVEAQRQYQDYSQRLGSMDAEITNLVQTVRSDAESARVKILTEAKRNADQIVIDSKRTAEAIWSEFRDKIRIDLANQVMARTEVLIKSKMTENVREQLRKDFSKQVESVQ
jgi:F0F1-type ATP synthase membrane subunit b/b'